MTSSATATTAAHESAQIESISETDSIHALSSGCNVVSGAMLLGGSTAVFGDLVGCRSGAVEVDCALGTVGTEDGGETGKAKGDDEERGCKSHLACLSRERRGKKSSATW